MAVISSGERQKLPVQSLGVANRAFEQAHVELGLAQRSGNPAEIASAQDRLSLAIAAREEAIQMVNIANNS